MADQISAMWGGQGIPRYELKYVIRKVRVLYQWGKTVNKIPKAVRKENQAQVKKAKQLFDVALCQCKVMVNDGCTCAKSDKVPRKEWEFLQDQRGPRLLVLGGEDRSTSALRTARQQRREIRVRQERARKR